ncbi:hypothetical protein L3Q82_013445, partial [Scortum barcoo]
MESPVGAPSSTLPGTPRRPGTLYCCSARRHKQQQETYPQPEGAGKRPSAFTGVNSNTWRLSWGAISKPTPARAAHPGQLQSSRGSSPSEGAGFQSPSYAWRVLFQGLGRRGGLAPLPRLLPKPHCTGPSWTFLRVVSLLEGGPMCRHFGLSPAGPVGKDSRPPGAPPQRAPTPG